MIPAYNHEKFIGAAIDSVLGQSVDDFELIIINDGSTDNTEEVITGYEDSRISYYSQENQDAFNTINRGLSLARGKYIAILNSDDVFTPNRLEKLLAFAGQHNSACVISDVIPISDEGIEFTDPDFGWNIWHAKNRDFYFKAGDMYTAFLKGNFMVTTSNLFMTREAVEKVGLFCSLRYLHDYDYIFRLMLAFPDGVHYCADEKLLYYRIHPGNTLGEAAIVGRRQDQELITKYMVQKMPESVQAQIAAGCERLVELGDELHEVRSAMECPPQGVRPAFTQLIHALKIWVKKKMS